VKLYFVSFLLKENRKILPGREEETGIREGKDTAEINRALINN